MKKYRDVLFKNNDNINKQIEVKILDSMNKHFKCCKIYAFEIFKYDYDTNLNFKDKKEVEKYYFKIIKEELKKKGFFVVLDEEIMSIFWNKKIYLLNRILDYSIVFLFVATILLGSSYLISCLIEYLIEYPILLCLMGLLAIILSSIFAVSSTS